MAAHVAGDGGLDAEQTIEHGLGAPEAAAGECCDFTRHSISPLHGRSDFPFHPQGVRQQVLRCLATTSRGPLAGEESKRIRRSVRFP